MLHFNNKVQGKIVSVYIMKAYMWHSTIDPLILNLSTRKSWVSNSTPRPPYSRARTEIHTE